MPAVTIIEADLTPFATIEATKAAELIADAVARAARVAPCILDPELSSVNAAAAKAIIRDVILRRNDSGSGAVVQQSAGPFSQTVTQTQRTTFWPSEVTELLAICADHVGTAAAGAFTIDTALGATSLHLPWCSLMFGAAYCSCGVDIAGYPIFELG